MEPLFLLAEKITGALKEVLSVDREQIGVINFEKALINNSSFEIYFSSKKTTIQLNLNTHHLEMPWAVQVNIISVQEKILLNDILRENKNNEVLYEVYPNLLRDPNHLGVDLANEIGNDILKYLKIKAV